jgi:hypothetical protein
MLVWPSARPSVRAVATHHAATRSTRRGCPRDTSCCTPEGCQRRSGCQHNQTPTPGDRRGDAGETVVGQHGTKRPVRLAGPVGYPTGPSAQRRASAYSTARERLLNGARAPTQRRASAYSTGGGSAGWVAWAQERPKGRPAGRPFGSCCACPSDGQLIDHRAVTWLDSGDRAPSPTAFTARTRKR